MINEDDRAKMSAVSKIGLLATTGEEGEPHISFISSVMPCGKRQLTAGQFCEGLSKINFQARPKTGFLIFTPDLFIWRGRALYSSSAVSGPEYEMYNQQPLFRYNTYFGIGTVHYFDLLQITPKEKLTMAGIALGALHTRLFSPFAASSKKGALNAISSNLFNQLDSLKFLSYIDNQGYPVLIPVLQAKAAGRDKVAFAFNLYRRELEKVPPGTKAAIFCVNLKMESVLAKGTYTVLGKAVRQGVLEIEKVYNSMPPQPGYIYPRPLKHEKVSVF